MVFGGDSPSAWVDPSIGTAATGHAFPGPCRPFGLVQPSSDTGNGSWKYCSGYAWTDTSVRRFSQTHVSGTGQSMSNCRQDDTALAVEQGRTGALG